MPTTSRNTGRVCLLTSREEGEMRGFAICGLLLVGLLGYPDPTAAGCEASAADAAAAAAAAAAANVTGGQATASTDAGAQS